MGKRMKWLTRGFVMLIVLCFCSLSVIANDGWLTSFDDAKKAAKKEDKDILLDFSGSDWCGWCIKLEEEVFSTEEWKKEGAKKFVMLLADFPKQKSLPKEQQEHNEKLNRKFGVEGFPTVYLLDSDGKPYAKTGYQKGGPEKYLEHLTEFSERKKERDKLLKEIKEASSEKKIPLLEQLIKQLNQYEVGFAYPELKEEIVALDPDNKKGLKIKYSVELVRYYRSEQDRKKSETYLDMVKKLDADKAKELEIEFKVEDITMKYFEKNDWESALKELNELAKTGVQGESAQKLYYSIALVNYQLKNTDEAINNLEKALKFAPNSELGKQIKSILEKMKK